MLPWLKVGHEQYRNSEFRAKASAVARCAYLELVMVSAQQSPIHSIPNDDAVLAGWSGIAINQWLKVRDVVLSQFTLGGDGRFYCPMLIELYKDTQPHQSTEMAEEKPLTKAERAKRYRDNKKGRDENNESSRDRHATVTQESDYRHESSRDRHATVTQESDYRHESSRDRHAEKVTLRDDAVTLRDDAVTLRDEMGGRGEDLDSELKQDLDLNQEVNTTTNVVSAPHTSERVKNKKSQSIFSANEMILSCENLSTEVATDFINYRKAKKAPLNKSIWTATVSEIQKSGMTPDSALSEAMSAGWTGLKAEWLINRNAKQSPNVIPMSSRPKLPSQMTEDERQELRRKNAAEAKKILFGDDDFIDGVASHV
jgi:hypothetical protein